MHDDTGLEALRATGLLDEAKTYMRLEGEAMKIVDKEGTVWWEDQARPVAPNAPISALGRPEIDRYLSSTFSLDI